MTITEICLQKVAATLYSPPTARPPKCMIYYFFNLQLFVLFSKDSQLAKILHCASAIVVFIN